MPMASKASSSAQFASMCPMPATSAATYTSATMDTLFVKNVMSGCRTPPGAQHAENRWPHRLYGTGQ